MPQSPALKTPSTARTAGRSDRAERRFRRQPFILLSFSSSEKLRKAQETQSYQRFQCIGHTDFKGLSNVVTNTHPLLPSMGTTRQKSSCRNRLQNGPHSLSCVKAGTHSALGERSHTRAHTPKQGSSLLRSQCGFVLPEKSLLFHRAFIYIHFPVLCEPPSSSRGGKSSKTAVTNAVPDRFSSCFSTSLTNGPRSLSRAKAGTHSAFGEKSHTRAHTA